MSVELWNISVILTGDGRLYSFRFAVSDSHSDSNMKIDLAYKMSNYSVSFYAINFLTNSILLQDITH